MAGLATPDIKNAGKNRAKTKAQKPACDLQCLSARRMWVVLFGQRPRKKTPTFIRSHFRQFGAQHPSDGRVLPIEGFCVRHRRQKIFKEDFNAENTRWRRLLLQQLSWLQANLHRQRIWRGDRRPQRQLIYRKRQHLIFGLDVMLAATLVGFGQISRLLMLPQVELSRRAIVALPVAVRLAVITNGTRGSLAFAICLTAQA